MTDSGSSADSYTDDNDDKLAEEVSRIKSGIDKLGEELGETSFDTMRDILSGDPEAISEAIMGDGDGPAPILFTMTTPKAIQPSLPTPSKQGPLPEPGPEKWYPARFDDTPTGKTNIKYLLFLKKAMRNESEAIRNLSYAEQLVPYIGCPKSSELWSMLNPLLTQVSNMQMYEIASDIAGYLYDSPEDVFPYIKCLNRVKPLLVRSSEKFSHLEERATQLVSLFESTIKSAEFHQDETIKFASQVSHVSNNLAGLQEVLEKTMIKVKKLDLLPELSLPSPTGISIPSTSTRPTGQNVIILNLSNPGEYTSHYSIKVENGKIKSVIPPRNHPELTSIIDLSPQVQDIFLNLNQAEILNRLSNYPEHRKAFTEPTLRERAPFLKELCKGVSKRTNQWTKLEPDI